MSRVIPLTRPRARQALSVAAASILLAGVGGVLGAPVAAQDLPACSPERPFDCRLPDWSEAVQRDIPSPFGEIEPVVWVDDPDGDAPSGGLDILGVGLGRVDIPEPASIRRSKDLLTLGKPSKAVRKGPGVVVRVVLDRPVDQVDGGHSGVHVATDIKGSRTDNAPSGVASPQHPFAGTGDIYSLTWAATTDKTRLLDSDLAEGWYKGEDSFAAAWAAPNVLDMLIAPQRFGDEFRVITHVDGAEGGYDTVALGLGAIPADGAVGLVPTCIEGSIAEGPFVVGRLIESGQTLRDVEAPASWRGGATLPIEPEIGEALEAVVATLDEDGDGRAGIASTVSLFEDGLVIRQRPEVQLAVDGDVARLAVELGLTRRGYNLLREVELEPTGDRRVDAWLERATKSLSEHMPPFRSTKKSGLVAGEGIGSCIPWLEEPPVPSPEPSPEASAPPPAEAAPEGGAAST